MPRKRTNRKGSRSRGKVQVPWGDRRTFVGKAKFKNFLKTIESADRFMQEGWARIIRSCNQYERSVLYSKIREVDPAGEKKLKAYVKSVNTSRGHRRTKAKREKWKRKHSGDLEEIKKPLVFTVEDDPADNVGSNRKPRKYKMRTDGVVRVAATLLAAGVTEDKVAEELGIDLNFILAHVKKKDVQAARNAPMLNQLAVIEADRKVVRDLTYDTVDKATDIADKIATRRRSIEVERSKTTPAGSFTEEERQEKEDTYKTRFSRARVVEAEVEDN